ncbi:ATP-binding protein [Streptomyces goshikiensis]|uniref:ATP-binding protein n=1 Tax=Streptomyces goshikiensis TaxID=1942 RepID=UPI0036BDBA2D
MTATHAPTRTSTSSGTRSRHHCVVGFVEHHHRPRTEVMLHGLEMIPRRGIEYRDTVFTEMDVDAVLARRPAVVLVDELAHTNVPGSRNTKRWQDVEELLQAGIDVVETITGVRQRETVPDEVVRRADQIELVDMSPQALRRRMAHGNIYKPDKVDAALSNYFRPGNLTALRELALLWVADRVDEYLQEYRGEHGIRSTWQARERIVVGLTGGPEGRTLIRRAARLAEKGAGGEVLAVHIARSDGLSDASPKELAVQRTLVEDLGGTFHHVIGDDVPHALLEFARGVNATQIVLGVSRRKPWQYVFGRGVSATVAVESGPDIDVHMVTHDAAAKGRRLPLARGARLGRSRIIWGWATGVAGPALLTLLLGQVLPGLGLANDMLLFLTCTVAAALLGGLLPALASAAFGSLLLNSFFTPPLYRLIISDPRNIVAISIFVGVAVSVASVVDLAARRTHRAARLRAESEILSFLAGSVLRGENSLDALLERLRETGLDEIVPVALGGLPDGSVELDIPETLPMVAVDRGLLERVVANVVENAVKYSPHGRPVHVCASSLLDRVELRVVDRGPGVPDEAKERIFEPFQRHGDAHRGAGVRLGLAVARGFTEAIGGTLTAEDTPGGGLTMVLTLRTPAGTPPANGELSPSAVT